VDRDSLGWRIRMSVDTELLEFSIETGKDSPLDAQGDYLVLTPMNLELLLHAKALQILFAGEQPLMVPLWPTDKGKLCFFVGMPHQKCKNEIIIMGHQILSCHVPVVKSFFIL
jgi:hypothetical protein